MPLSHDSGQIYVSFGEVNTFFFLAHHRVKFVLNAFVLNIKLAMVRYLCFFHINIITGLY